MGAQSEFVTSRLLNGGAHGVYVPGVAAAGDVDRGEGWHEGFLRAVGDGLWEFAHVTVEVDGGHGPSAYQQIWRGKQGLLLQQQSACSAPIDRLEADFVARAELAKAMKVCGNHVGDFRIAARGLLLDKQDDGLAAGGDLNGAK